MEELERPKGVSEKMMCAVRYYLYCVQYTSHNQAMWYVINRYRVSWSDLTKAIRLVDDYNDGQDRHDGQ